MDEKGNPTKIDAEHAAYVAAYDERTQLFNQMRQPNLSDDARQELQAAYKKAAKDFDQARTNFIK